MDAGGRGAAWSQDRLARIAGDMGGVHPPLGLAAVGGGSATWAGAHPGRCVGCARRHDEVLC
eukprot:14361649-Heterocapsa_arctica.AAC.1